MTIDNGLKFDERIDNVCIKYQRKLMMLMRIRKYLDFNEFIIQYYAIWEYQNILPPGADFGLEY